MRILERIRKLPQNKECADCKVNYVSGCIQMIQHLSHILESIGNKENYFVHENWILSLYNKHFLIFYIKKN